MLALHAKPPWLALATANAGSTQFVSAESEAMPAHLFSSMRLRIFAPADLLVCMGGALLQSRLLPPGQPTGELSSTRRAARAELRPAASPSVHTIRRCWQN